MAMALNNDGGVNAGLGTLNKNIAKVGADLRKIASGQRINGAGDAASEFAIGKKMRVLTRALGQDIENSQKGIDLVNVAERGINSIVDELRNLKRMALDSANDHNTDVDRATIQKEFSSRMAEIDDIAATTNYNGIYLLDGRWYRSSGGYNTEKVTETVTTYETVTEPYTETVTTYEEIEEEYPYTYTKTTEKPLESHAVRPSAATPTGVSEPGVFYVGGNPVQATKVITATSNYTISSDGAYMIPENYTGDLHITARNVKLVRQNPAKPLYDVFIDTSSAGNTNLWLEDLDLRYRVLSLPTETDDEGYTIPYVFDQSFIKFQGENNVLTLKNENRISIGESGVGHEEGIIYEKAFINVGDGLTIEGSGTLEFHEGGLPHGEIRGALIGSDYRELSTANITINGGNIITSSEESEEKKYTYGNLGGAVIGTGRNGRINDIVINGGTFDLFVSGGGACIGGGHNGALRNITVQDAIIKAKCDDGACIGGGASDLNASDEVVPQTSYLNNIYILNSNLDLQNTELAHTGWEGASGTGAAIGGGGTYNGTTSYVYDITVENSTVKAVTDRGAGIGTGGDSEHGGVGEPHAYGISIIDSTLDITVNNSRAEKSERE
ncbi:MAG: flagellin [Selenomonadaceae bacterium]|nr:flagellin [Selenomonadaceae bacterium]